MQVLTFDVSSAAGSGVARPNGARETAYQMFIGKAPPATPRVRRLVLDPAKLDDWQHRIIMSVSERRTLNTK